MENKVAIDLSSVLHQEGYSLVNGDNVPNMEVEG